MTSDIVGQPPHGSREPLRIAYVINSMEAGGTTSQLPAIVDVLRRRGAEVRVFALTRRDGLGLPALEDAAIEVVVRDGGENDHWAALGWLIAELRGWSPTHLWTSLTRATLLGQLAGLRLSRPVVSWQHHVFLKPANLRLLRLTRRLSTLWIADSAAVAKLTALRLKVPRERLMTWPIFRADPEAPRAAPWAPGEILRIGTLGRLHPNKGFDILVTAAAILNAMGVRYDLTICGEGAERERLVGMAAAFNLANVHFPGHRGDPAQFLAGLHLYIQPSWAEGFCIAAHEAMLAGLPVIASAVGEMASSIVPGVSGDLVPPGSIEMLARMITQRADDPARLAAMGAEARSWVLDTYGPDRFEAAGRAVVDRLLAITRA